MEGAIWIYWIKGIWYILTDYASDTIKIIKIEHLKSWYGSSHGNALYTGSNCTISGDYDIN